MAQFDAYFPRSNRRVLFEQEFLENIKATGFDAGKGKKKYWRGALWETLAILESQKLRVRMNKMIKNITIQERKSYHLLLEFAVHEAYVLAIK